MRSRRAGGRLIGMLAALASMLVSACDGAKPTASARGETERPVLLLLTSLPIVFGEEFALEGHGSPALDALGERFRVLPISVADSRELAQGELLLMAHPPAQPAEALVDLDSWVRAGGKVLLLADPALDWESSLPLGSPLRPPPMFADTGLLRHWGLTLGAPAARGPQSRQLGGKAVLTSSPGELAGGCDISGDRFVARCAIGKGRSTVVADADFLNVAQLGPGSGGNLDALLAELATLRR